MVFLFFHKKFIGRAFVIYSIFCKGKNSFHAHSSSLQFFGLSNRCRWAFFFIWRLCFVEIVMHGYSTTVAIISKNNILLICFIFNGVSIFLQKFSRQGVRHLLIFL